MRAGAQGFDVLAEHEVRAEQLHGLAVASAWSAG
jgi:hypothetical protein